MTDLADYLDLLEPSRTGFAPSRPGVPYRPMHYARAGFAPLAADSFVLSRPATTTSKKSRSTGDRAAASIADRYRRISTVRIPSADPAADRARADCVAMCAGNPSSPDCRPDAPGQPGSGGFCAAWLPGGAQGAPPAGPAPCPAGTYGPGVPNCAPGTNPDPAPPSCPEGSSWNGSVCEAFATTEKKSSAPMWIGLIALALVARRFL